LGREVLYFQGLGQLNVAVSAQGAAKRKRYVLDEQVGFLFARCLAAPHRDLRVTIARRPFMPKSILALPFA
jgi:hypothetical protein